MKKIRFHDLRHTSASLLFCADVHPKVVHEQLGHSSIKNNIRYLFTYDAKYTSRCCNGTRKNVEINTLFSPLALYNYL